MRHWLVLERIRSPGNLGTILRTAEACGIGGIIFIGPACDPYESAVVRASMGGMFHLPLVRTTHHDLARWASAHCLDLVGLSPRVPELWTDLPPDAPIGLVIGEERKGISARLRRLCQTEVRLPMTGRADSLNVGVAAGVIMYELVRRQQVRSRSSPRPAPGR